MTLEEIQKAVKELSPSDLVHFHKWFTEFNANFKKVNALESTIEERLKNLQGSLKGKGVLKAFMAEKKREKDL